MKAARRLPFAALTDAMGEVYYPSRGQQWGRKDTEEWVRHSGNPTTILSELTGVSRRCLIRWAKDGIPEDAADRIACLLGLHVSLIWPSWFAECGEPLSRTADESHGCAPCYPQDEIATMNV